MAQHKHQQLSHRAFESCNWKVPGWKSLLPPVWDSDSGIPYMSEFSPEKLPALYSSTTTPMRQPIAAQQPSEVPHSIPRLDRLEMILAHAIEWIYTETDWDYAEAWIPDGDRQLLKSSPVWYCRNEKLRSFRDWSKTLTFAPGEGLPGQV